MEHTRTKRILRLQVRLLRQRLYLWKRFRKDKLTTSNGIMVKRVLAKALRNRLAAMSKAEAYLYWGNPTMKGVLQKERLERRHLRERKMILSILTDMYTRFTGPNHLGVE